MRKINTDYIAGILEIAGCFSYSHSRGKIYPLFRLRVKESDKRKIILFRRMLKYLEKYSIYLNEYSNKGFQSFESSSIETISNIILFIDSYCVLRKKNHDKLKKIIKSFTKK